MSLNDFLSLSPRLLLLVLMIMETTTPKRGRKKLVKHAYTLLLGGCRRCNEVNLSLLHSFFFFIPSFLLRFATARTLIIERYQSSFHRTKMHGRKSQQSKTIQSSTIITYLSPSTFYNVRYTFTFYIYENFVF